MAEVSFQRSTAAPVDAEVIKETVATPVPGVTIPTITTIAPAASIPTAPVLAVAVSPPAGAVSQHDPTAFDDDNLGFQDIVLPRINLVQKVGPLSNIFESGELVLNQELVIHTPAFIHPTDPAQNKPGTGLLNLVVIGFRTTQFAEKVAGGERGILLDSETQVPKNNGTLDYKEWEASIEAAKTPGAPAAKRYFERLATCMVLIERPAHIPDAEHRIFSNECEGKYYALALWSFKGMSYTAAAKGVFFTQRKVGSCKKDPKIPRMVGYLTHGWTVTSRLKLAKTGNFSYVPVVKAGPPTSDAFKAFAREIIG